MAEQQATSRTSSHPFQSAYVDGRIVCSLCYDNGKEVKSFLIGPGIEQHLRRMHKKEKHHSIELGRKSELLTKRLHGDKTMAFMTEVMKNKAVQDPTLYQEFTCKSVKRHVPTMKVKARGSHEASKVFGLLHHYSFLKDITGSPCIVEVWMSDVHHAHSKSSYKLWKMDEKIYCECTVKQAVGNCFEGLDCTPQAVLEQMFGFESFRPGQEEAIESLLNNKDTIAIVPTGGVKTLIYTIPCMMKKGLSVVISPLLILMYDQVARLRQLGVNTCYYNTLLEEQDRKSILHILQQSDCQYEFVFVSPEAVLTETFIPCLKNINTAAMLNYVIIDEAHCIDAWGNYFRPEYGQLGKHKDLLSVPVAALTGTASKMTIEIIRSQLHMKDTSIVRLPCHRNNLTYTILKKPESKLHYFVASYLACHHSNDCGIIYCGTQASATQMAFALKEQNLSVTFYHAGMEVYEKLANSNLWFEGSANIVCRTSAFGMAIDKQNVRFVIHLAIPSSPDELLQESGRAGRDGEPASCTIFFRFADRSLHLRHIARTDNPSVQEEALRLLNSLCCIQAFFILH
eukprot:Seg5055.2 transcript_id=Seg5055.2/GoldUCD/mRNA.D3Y31 product="ATP-dependent DNA helicase Q5" protein_id=Seg5055.2/GoldUCD/D3Y31